MAVTLAAQSGQLELNAFLPLVAHALLGNLALLERACTIFRERCIEGIVANAARCSELLEHSHAQVTALVPVLGYELAADIAREAQQEKESIRNVVLARGLIAPQVLDRLLSADAMTALGYSKE
jgi:aspartate ammonia-lyase